MPCLSILSSRPGLSSSFQLGWRVRRHSGCSRLRIPVFWWQKGQVPAADFSRLERGKGFLFWTVGVSLGGFDLRLCAFCERAGLLGGFLRVELSRLLNLSLAARPGSGGSDGFCF